jgi:hypothetical protein
MHARRGRASRPPLGGGAGDGRSETVVAAPGSMPPPEGLMLLGLLRRRPRRPPRRATPRRRPNRRDQMHRHRSPCRAGSPEPASAGQQTWSVRGRPRGRRVGPPATRAAGSPAVAGGIPGRRGRIADETAAWSWARAGRSSGPCRATAVLTPAGSSGGDLFVRQGTPLPASSCRAGAGTPATAPRPRRLATRRALASTSRCRPRTWTTLFRDLARLRRADRQPRPLSRRARSGRPQQRRP